VRGCGRTKIKQAIISPGLDELVLLIPPELSGQDPERKRSSWVMFAADKG
jgi:hypothetical protein